ncbi:MAG: YfhO family protein [Christensenellales bacterium]
MAILKHAVCATTSFCYLRRMMKNERLALLGSVLYTFSSFTLVNTQFYHFTEVIAFFPLILLGMEMVMSDLPHFGALALFCGLNTLTNYYFMLSSALLAALYFVFRFFSEDWKPYRTVRRVFSLVFECGIGCALAGVLLCPAMLFMLSITRTGAGDTPLLAQHYTFSVLLERLRALLMPIESNVVHAYYGDAGSWCSTAAYLPVFGMTGAAVFAFAQKKQHWLKLLLLTLLISAARCRFCAACSRWKTNVGYTRWWYGLALITTLATLYVLQPFAEKTDAPNSSFRCLCRVDRAGSAADRALYASGKPADDAERKERLCRANRSGASEPSRRRVCVKCVPNAVRLCHAARRRRDAAPHFEKAALYRRARARLRSRRHPVCRDIAVGDKYLLSGSETPGQGIYTLSEIAKPTLEAAAQPDFKDWRRIDYGKKIRNYGLLRGASSLTSFMSLRASTIGRFVSMAGFGYDESTTVCPPNDSAALRAFLSVTEYYKIDDFPVPEGFVLDREENGLPVYTNPNAVPMGFLQTVCTGTHHQRMDSETVPTVMLAAVTLEDDALGKYGDRMAKLDVYAIPDWRESVARLKENAYDSFEIFANGFTAKIDAKGRRECRLYTIPFDKGFSATIDAGQKAEIVNCDVAFMGVFVEAGAHEIVFTYDTRGLTLGVVMSLLAAGMPIVDRSWLQKR